MKETITFQTTEGFPIVGDVLRFGRRSGAFEGFAPHSVFHRNRHVERAEIKRDSALIFSGRIDIYSIVDAGASCICGFTTPVIQPVLEVNPGSLLTSYHQCLDSWHKAKGLLLEYRLLVHDMARLLGTLRQGLDGDWEDARSGIVDTERLRELARALGPEAACALDSVWEGLDPIAPHIPEEASILYEAYLRQHLSRYLLTSPFAYRAFTKPLGYAGDYGCVNMIEGDPYQGASVFAMLVNYWLLQQLPSRAHRSRIDYLEKALAGELARLESTHGRLRVFSLGCGPAIEVQRILRSHASSSNIDFTLLDFNRQTIDFVSSVLDGLCRQHQRRTSFKFITGSVREFLRDSVRARRPSGGEYDLVYCAGLFDYLPDLVCSHLLSRLYEFLRPGGLLLATNVKASRAIDLSLRYMLDWRLLCRDHAQFMALSPSAAPVDSVSMFGVDRGYNLFLEIRKPYEVIHG